MESLARWLEGLATAKPSTVRRHIVRMFVPGHAVMDLDGWLMTTEQPRAVPAGFRGGYPESMVLLAYLDDATFAQNAIHHHRLAADIAAAMSVALERRIDIPFEIAARIEGADSLTFLPFGAITDRVITGPLPSDSVSQVAEVFRKVGGLAKGDLATLGAATSLFHGALLLHERDVRSAYTLLVAGIEALSREYGQPPTDWHEWEVSSKWDAFAAEHQLSEVQAGALRDRLMEDRQLRLKATFRSYASSRLRSIFWEQPWVEWMYSFDIPGGRWLEPEILYEGRLNDFLPTDRAALREALGHSYDLRSSYLHEGVWFGPLELTLEPAVTVGMDRPLPFAVLRAILRELILVELAERTQGGSLPDVQLQRLWASPTH